MTLKLEMPVFEIEHKEPNCDKVLNAKALIENNNLSIPSLPSKLKIENLFLEYNRDQKEDMEV